MFFYDADTGAKLGQWVLPRAQGADENCTIHNYYYNNFVFESDIIRGLNVFRASDRAMAGAIRLDRLNPQTMEFSLDG